MARRRTGSGSGGNLVSPGSSLPSPRPCKGPSWGQGRGDGAAWPGPPQPPSWVTGPASSSPPHRRPFFPPRTERQCLPAACPGPATSSLGWENKAPPTQAEGKRRQWGPGERWCSPVPAGATGTQAEAECPVAAQGLGSGTAPSGSDHGVRGLLGVCFKASFPWGLLPGWGGLCSKKALNHLSLQSLSLWVSHSPSPYSLEALLGCLRGDFKNPGSSPRKQVRWTVGDSGGITSVPHTEQSPGTPTPQEAPLWSLCQGGVNSRGCLGGQGRGEPSS